MSEHKVRPRPASLLRPTWFEIDLDAIAHNLRQLRRMVGSGVAIYACLKRNAYGCGAVPVAQVIQREGAEAIAVGNINDALAIREAQVALPILLYPNCLASDAGPAVMRHRLMPTISSLDDVAAWEQAADGGTLDAFAKIDVGLFRGGCRGSAPRCTQRTSLVGWTDCRAIVELLYRVGTRGSLSTFR